jgi:hypothetical protein
MNTTKLGLALMTVGTVAGIWSSVNPSYFTIRKFGVTDDDKRLIYEGVLIAIALIVVTLVGVWMVFR